MTAALRSPGIEALTAQALQQEAEGRLAAGEVLVDGTWLPPDRARQARRTDARRRLLGSLEALIYWSVVALVGLTMLTLVTALI